MNPARVFRLLSASPATIHTVSPPSSPHASGVWDSRAAHPMEASSAARRNSPSAPCSYSRSRYVQWAPRKVGPAGPQCRRTADPSSPARSTSRVPNAARPCPRIGASGMPSSASVQSTGRVLSAALVSPEAISRMDWVSRSRPGVLMASATATREIASPTPAALQRRGTPFRSMSMTATTGRASAAAMRGVLLPSSATASSSSPETVKGTILPKPLQEYADAKASGHAKASR